MDLKLDGNEHTHTCTQVMVIRKTGRTKVERVYKYCKKRRF